MKKLSILLRLIGIVQIILGVGFLLFPAISIGLMGLSERQTDTNYLLGMLAARFIAYGIGMFVIANNPTKNIFWIKNMILIQVIDLTVGLFYTINGTLPISVSAFPMFNAAIFTFLLSVWIPKKQ